MRYAPATHSLNLDEERYRIALEAAGLGAWDYEPATGALHWDARCRELFGLPEGEPPRGADFLNWICEEDREAVMTALQEALRPRSGGRYQVEYHIPDASGAGRRRIRATGKAYFNDEGNAERFIGTVQDISGERSLQEDQQKLLTLVDKSADLMSILSLDGTNTYLNEAGRRLLGFDDMAHVRRTPIADLHTPEHFAQVEAEVLPSVMNNGHWSGQMLVRHLKTGEIFPVYNHTIRIDDPVTGRPLAVGAVMRDLRPEIAARRRLGEAQADLAVAIELAELGNWDMNLRESCITLSGRLAGWFGFGVEEMPLPLTAVFDRLHAEDLQSVREAVQQALQPGSGRYDAETASSIRTTAKSGCCMRRARPILMKPEFLTASTAPRRILQRKRMCSWNWSGSSRPAP